MKSGDINRNNRNYCVVGWEIKEPEINDSSQVIYSDYIKNELSYVESLIKNRNKSGEYRGFFDIESAINWWFVALVSTKKWTSLKIK